MYHGISKIYSPRDKIILYYSLISWTKELKCAVRNLNMLERVKLVFTV
jgi:hypothetical protein